MLYNIHYEIAAILFMALILIFYIVQFTPKYRENNNFTISVIAIFIMTITDVLSAITISYYREVPLWLNYLLNSANYVSMVWVGYRISKYFDSIENTNPKGQIVNRRILQVFIISEIGNLFGKYYFYFDPATGYHHAKMYYLQHLFIYYYVVYVAVIMLKNYKKYDSKRRTTVAAYVAMMTIVAAFQSFLMTDTLLTGLGGSFLLFIMYMNLETPDYHKLMETMEELEEARALADEANESKSKFLANMSHEIRTPINSIMGMNEMIRRETTETQIKEYADDVKVASDTLLTLVNDILDFSKIESGVTQITCAEYNIGSLLNDVITIMSVKAEQKSLHFDVVAPNDTPAVLWGDSGRIKQIMVNLLNNSIKYTEAGSVVLNLGWTPMAKEEIGELKGDDIDISAEYIKLQIAVTDSGIGIRKEDLDKLFVEFERVDLEHTRSIEGTGLGLSITSKLLYQMNGSISVDSEYGVGSTFIAEVPQKVIKNIPMGDYKKRVLDKQKTNYKESFRAPDCRILVVDDNRMNLLVCEKLLGNTLLQIDKAESGKQALAFLSKNKYDVVLLDHMMPIMDGVETLKAAKALKLNDNKDPVYIALTANAIVGAKESYIKLGFDDYLSKPVTSKELEALLIKYLPADKVELVPEDEGK